MRTVILAGGLGTRLAEETAVRPKPMVEIGGWPMLCHIMSIYAAHGHRDFVVSGGYKCEMIKEYFCNFRFHASDVYVDLGRGEVELTRNKAPDWRVAIVDTGVGTQTGGRIKALEPMLRDGPFMATYGDGLADVDVAALVAFHRAHGRLATLTAVRPPARFGALVFQGERVVEFSEKPQVGEGWINGGFMVFEPEALAYIDGPESVLERGPLERLAADGQLMAYRHEGFWQPMDTIREKQYLESLWQAGNAPWRPSPQPSAGGSVRVDPEPQPHRPMTGVMSGRPAPDAATAPGPGVGREP